MKKKVSFDFDKTLSTWRGQAYAKELIERGYEVWLVTFRYEKPRNGFFDNNAGLFRIAEDVGIDKDNIIFTNFVFKHNFFKDNDDFIFHLDDSYDEISMINDSCENTKGIWFIGESWKPKCEELMLP